MTQENLVKRILRAIAREVFPARTAEDEQHAASSQDNEKMLDDARKKYARAAHALRKGEHGADIPINSIEP